MGSYWHLVSTAQESCSPSHCAQGKVPLPKMIQSQMPIVLRLRNTILNKEASSNFPKPTMLPGCSETKNVHGNKKVIRGGSILLKHSTELRAKQSYREKGKEVG